jgi:deazaflavin-dependent oxidoreductase (nitroreductase family)
MRRTRGSLADRFGIKAPVLSTVGRKTRRPREVVLRYFPDGDAFVIVATNDGGATDPAWYLNLMAGDRAEVEVRGQRIAVVPTRLEGEGAAAWWRGIVALSPDYERYAGRPTVPGRSARPGGMRRLAAAAVPTRERPGASTGPP